MKHYTKWKWCHENRKWICEYVELNEDHWFDGVADHVIYNDGEEPMLYRVEVKYHSKEHGRRDWRGRKYWEPAGIYSIAREDKRELHRLMKFWFPNCEYKYEYR